jgi:putative endonuclease
MDYWVYILYSVSTDKYYVGHTDNLYRRLTEHNTGQTRYTSNIASDWEVVYAERFDSRSLAMKREKTIKGRKSRKYIEQLVRASRS